MTSIILVVLSVIVVFFFYIKRKSKIIDVNLSKEILENTDEPIISYSIYTVDTQLNHRYLNYPNKKLPHNFGILKHQYIELDWNILNADFIFIEGVGIVNAVGRKAFYPTGNTQYKITAKNKNTEIQQLIFVQIFPVSVVDKLLVKLPKIDIQSKFSKIDIQTIQQPLINIKFPDITIPKPSLEKLNVNLAIKNSNSFQKLVDYIQNKKQ